MRVVTARSLTLLVAIVATACCAMAPARAVDWPEAPWSPAAAMGVKLSHIRLDHVNVLTALAVLGNECGLVFGCAYVGPPTSAAVPVSLDLHDVTVRQVVAKIEEQAPDYVFETIADVAVAARKDEAGLGPRALLEVVRSFAVKDATRREAERAVYQAAQVLRGLPPLGGAPSEGRMPPPSRKRVTLSLANVPFGELAARVAAETCDSWILYVVEHERASFGMAQKWGLWGDSVGRYEVELAADSAQRPRMATPPTREVVADRVSAAVRRGRELLDEMRNGKGPQGMADAVQTLCDLVGDDYAQWEATQETMDAVRLLGDLQAEAAVPTLVANITFSGDNGRERFPSWVLRLYEDGGYQKFPNGMQSAYREWVQCFPCVDALTMIGQPSVAPLVVAIGDTKLEPLRDTVGARMQAESAQGKIVLLCETLVRILGADKAGARLRDAAAAEKDPVKAARLREAADRIAKGLPPGPNDGAEVAVKPAGPDSRGRATARPP